MLQLEDIVITKKLNQCDHSSTITFSYSDKCIQFLEKNNEPYLKDIIEENKKAFFLKLKQMGY